MVRSRWMWLALPFVCVMAMVSGRRTATAEPPNIIFVLADDLGWTDLACQGSQYYRTPHLDRLASQGMRMQRFYMSQNCAPTRAALMTGQYAPRTGIYTVGSGERGDAADRGMEVPANITRLPLDRVLLPQLLRQAGYATGMFGKWHLGHGPGYHPADRGFDEALVAEGQHFQFATSPPTEYPDGQYLADFLTDRAVDFMERHREQPFFLYVSHFAVHRPMEARSDYEAWWRQQPPAGTHWHPVYAAMIQSVDESVGRIMACLDALQLTDNTLLVFTSDNGGLGGYDDTPLEVAKEVSTDNAPLRGGKGTLYEGGLRVPFLARWPGVIPPGTLSDTVLAHVDILPTFAEIAGLSLPVGPACDGTSFVPLLRDPAAALGRPAIYWHFPGYLESYVRKTGWRTTPVGVIHAGDFKLMEFFEDDHVELYDVSKDLGETTNLAARMPDKVEELQTALARWRAEINAPMPTRKAGDR